MAIDLRSAISTGSGIRMERLILTSGQFIAPDDGEYLITAIGPGGSGAVSPSSGNGLAATGGAAGGLAQKLFRMTTGDALNIVIGAGGAAQSTPGSNGNAGGTTSVTGTGIALIANGGEGGKTRAAGAGTAAGAVGGTATGGDLNVQGGGSGSATVAAVAGCQAATGGGAVGVYGVGYPSGNATSSVAYAALTGGAGVGGKSGNATSTVSGSISLGGGAIAASGDAVNTTGPAVLSNLGRYNDPGLQSRLLSPVGSNSPTGSAGYIPGGGTVAASGSTSGAGIFAGGGGKASSSSSSIPGFGGGSGGVASAASDKGGDGCVVIEWIKRISA